MSAPPVVALHGFGGHGESWSAVRAALGGRRVEAITLFGHETGVVPPGLVAFEDEVARVASAIRTVGEPVRLCGYSMGGRVALGILARAPELVASAVIIGAHPGLESTDDRSQRAVADEVWVRVLEDEGLAVFTEKWQAQPLFATQARLGAEVLEAQRRVRMRHDAHALALAMTSLGLASMPSYWDALAGITVPVDLVVGALDEKFTALARRMNQRLGRSIGRVIGVEGAGHNVLLESPVLLAQVIESGRGTALPPGLGVV